MRIRLLIALLLISTPALAQVTPPSGNSNTPVRSVTTGTTDTATAADGLVQWNSPALGAKTETLPTGTINGQSIQISDGFGNAAIYPIILQAPNGTIGGNGTLQLSDDFFNISLKWDNLSNWIVTGYYPGTHTTSPPAYLLVSPTVILGTGTGSYLRLR